MRPGPTARFLGSLLLGLAALAVVVTMLRVVAFAFTEAAHILTEAVSSESAP